MPSSLGSNVDRAEPVTVACFHVGAVAHKQGDQVTLRGNSAEEIRVGGCVLRSVDTVDPASPQRQARAWVYACHASDRKNSPTLPPSHCVS